MAKLTEEKLKEELGNELKIKNNEQAKEVLKFYKDIPEVLCDKILTDENLRSFQGFLKDNLNTIKKSHNDVIQAYNKSVNIIEKLIDNKDMPLEEKKYWVGEIKELFKIISKKDTSLKIGFWAVTGAVVVGILTGGFFVAKSIFKHSGESYSNNLTGLDDDYTELLDEPILIDEDNVLIDDNKDNN